MKLQKILMMCVIVFFAITKAYTQNKDSTTSRFFIYTSPLSAVNVFESSRPTLGVEVLPLAKWGLSAEFGIKILDFPLHRADTSVIKSQGYMYRFEIKRYDIFNFIRRKGSRDYFSIEYRYIKDNASRKVIYNFDQNDCFGVIKEVYIGNVKYGYVISLNKLWYVDAYAGIGFRERVITNRSIEYNPALGDYQLEYEFLSGSFENESGLKLNLSLGAKIGIRF